MVGLRNQHDVRIGRTCVSRCSNRGLFERGLVLTLNCLQRGCGAVAKLRQGSSLMEGVMMVS